MFEDIQFAKLVQQQIVSCFAIFRKQSPMDPNLPNAHAGYGASGTEISSTGQTRYTENIGPGMEIYGAPGEELQGFSPNVPNAEYFDHVKLTLQIIGVNLGLPLCLVLMDGSETNFSGWRGAVDEARKGFRSQQRNIINRFHTPVYRWKLHQWISEDAALRNEYARRGDGLFAHEWHAPRWGYIDPVSDAQGDALRLQNGLTSHRRLHAERGHDWESVADETIEDTTYAIERAIKQAAVINKKLAEGQPPVHWRELISLPMPNGIQMTMQDPNVVEAQTAEVREGTEA
jgi:capsid protein